MTEATPVTAAELDFYRVLADPEATRQRAAELLSAADQASATIRDADRKRSEAEALMASAMAENAKAQELQNINAKKSTALKEQAEALAKAEAKAAAAHEDNKARLAEWEQRLKTEAARLEAAGKHWAELEVQQEERARALAERLEAATLTIERAERIRAASES